MENDKKTVTSRVDEPNNKPITQTENNLTKLYKHIKLSTDTLMLVNITNIVILHKVYA
jgi:hypothetical protein